MTAPTPTRSSPLRRYGPIIAIVVVIAVVAVVAIVAGRGDDSDDAATTSTTTVAIENLPVTFAEAQERGLDVDFGDRCDTERGTVKMPASIAPPCVPEFTGDNGGATAKGVTGDTIKVAYYVPPPGTDAQQALQGLVDDPEATRQTRDNFTAMLNETFETYGRKVELVQVQASGQATDDVAAKNDAVRIAEEIGAFAVIGGPNLTNVYADELVSRGVMCFQCGLVAPDTVYQKNAPYMWSNSATPEEFLAFSSGVEQPGSIAERTRNLDGFVNVKATASQSFIRFQPSGWWAGFTERCLVAVVRNDGVAITVPKKACIRVEAPAS